MRDPETQRVVGNVTFIISLVVPRYPVRDIKITHDFEIFKGHPEPRLPWTAGKEEVLYVQMGTVAEPKLFPLGVHEVRGGIARAVDSWHKWRS